MFYIKIHYYNIKIKLVFGVIMTEKSGAIEFKFDINEKLEVVSSNKLIADALRIQHLICSNPTLANPNCLNISKYLRDRESTDLIDQLKESIYQKITTFLPNIPLNRVVVELNTESKNNINKALVIYISIGSPEQFIGLITAQKRDGTLINNLIF